MELDFSGLNKLSGPVKDFEPVEEGHPTAKPGITPEAPEKALETKKTLASIKLNAQQENQRKLNEMYGYYQNNSQKASVYMTQLLKGARAGEPLANLLLTACKCISAMTGEQVFYDQIEGDIKAIYGEAFKDMGALDYSLSDAQNRLQMLQEASQREGLTPDEKKRLDNAIKAHKATLEKTGDLHMEAIIDLMF